MVVDWNKVADAAKKFFEEVKEAVDEGAASGQDTAETTAGEAADAARDSADDVASEVRRGVSQIAAEVQRGVARITETVTRVVEAVAEGGRIAGGEIGYAAPSGAEDGYEERLLTDAEKNLGREVFEKTLPYGAIWLSNGLGFGRRPYTIPHPLHAGSYVIHFGPDVFDDATDSSVTILGLPSDVAFIHELTHVWQGHHRRNPFDYMVDSVYNQIRWGTAAYDYTLEDDSEWSDFGAEQQAHIVEDWYALGKKEDDDRFRFIRDNIRSGTP